MFNKIPASTNAPAFTVPYKSQQFTLTHSSYTFFLKQLLDKCGIDSAKYSGYSFRSGGLQEAAHCQELNLLDLMTHGTWK